MIRCRDCERVLDGEEIHYGHDERCEGTALGSCTCDVYHCAGCCPECTCRRCRGEGSIPCAHGLGHDCGCPIWECPDCNGTGEGSVDWPTRINFDGPVPVWVYERDGVPA